MERRFYEVSELRAADGEGGGPGKIEGYAAVFDSLSVEMWGFRERIAPGSFASSIEQDDIRALWQHDTSAVLGRTKAQTMRMIEDDIGLRVSIDAPDTQIGRDAVTSIRRGDVDQMSFGFEVLDSEWDQDDDGVLIRTLFKVKLYEVSPVTFPAYANTAVSVRSGNDPVYGIIPEIPAGVRGATATADDDGDLLRAQMSKKTRERILSILRSYQ